MRELNEILRSNAFKFNKSFGQNFITDTNLLCGICADADITDADVVVEIGAGGGTLTRQLAQRAKRVIAFEVDRNLQPVLSETLDGLENVELQFADVMKTDIAKLNGMCAQPFKVVANLPYYITTPLILRLIEGGANLLSMTVMVQKEVAERLCAQPDTEQYGSVTVAVDAVADCRISRIVGRKMFYPVPNVDSAVVVMKFRKKYDIPDFSLFRKTYRSAFQMRRKTYVNNLISAFGMSRECAETVLKSINVNVNARGETLATEQFCRLAKKISEVEL